MPRPEGLPATLNEVMGRKSEVGSMDDLPAALGEKMPELEFNEVGRLRLLKALKNRFGEGFRNMPGISKVIKEFDTEMKTRVAIKRNGRK